MKKVVLIGASGYIGSAIRRELLDRKHQVSAVVRNPDRIIETNPLLTVIKANVSFSETVTRMCIGADAVISAYNPGWRNPNIAEETRQVYPIILEGVKRAKVKRFLVVGGAGYLYVSPGLRLIDSGVMPDAFKPAVNALGKFYTDHLMKEKDLDWVFFSPAADIFQGEKTGKFRLGKDDLIVDEEGHSRISVGDYAVAMVDELEKEEHHRERFTIGY